MEDDQLEKSSTTNDVVAVEPKGEVAAAENPSSQDSNQLQFTGDEETLIIRMYNLVGERWSLIAGRIPGRSAEEIEKYWKSRHTNSIGSEPET